MKKIMRICRENNFNQRTFYQWLVDNFYLEKAEIGHQVGKRGLKGMKNFPYALFREGEIQQRSQVIVETAMEEEIIAAYKAAPLEKKYVAKKKVATLQEKILDLENRLVKLEKIAAIKS